MGTNPYFSQQSFNKLSSKRSPKNVVLVFMIIPVLLPRCSKRMSLEEAKQVTLSISSKSFVPPPRRIDDVGKILDENSADSTTVESLQVTADSVPPVSVSKLALQEFYDQRRMAAATLGRYRQSLMDLRKAVSLFGHFSSRTPTINKMIIELTLKHALVDLHVSICHHAAYHHLYWTAAVVHRVNYRCIVGRRLQAQRHHAT